MPQAKPEKLPYEYVINKTVFWILGQVGCLTVLILLGALLLGSWLDSRLGSRPWALVLLITLSVPVTTFMIYRRVKSATAHLADEPANKVNGSEEVTARE